MKPPMDSEEDLLAQDMAAADVRLEDIEDRVYEKMVRRSLARVEVAGRHIESFF